MDNPVSKPHRHYNLDWLRVLVILNLIPFHAAWLVAFVGGSSYIPQDTFVVSLFKHYIYFTRQWHMALLFFISGAAACMALNFRSPGQYVKERLRRLFIPFVFFMLFLQPLWAYYWPTTPVQKSIAVYFFKFWPWIITHIFVYGWNHMWFVLYLMVCSLFSLPLFLYIINPAGRLLVKKCADLIQAQWLLFLPGILLTIIWLPLSVKWPYEFGGRTLITDWTYFSFNLIVFILGFITCMNERFWEAIQKRFPVFLLLGVVLAPTEIFMCFKLPAFSTPAYTLNYFIYSSILCFNIWFWVLALVGLSRRYLSFSNSFLHYFNKASYPFFIIHLVVMIVLGYFVAKWRTGIFTEFIILIALTFILTIACYELLKRAKITRFLFGIK